jgi:hypothetical protein
MNRGPLKFLAALLGTLMAVVPFAGLDHLPGDLRTAIAAERKAFSSAQAGVQSAREEVNRDLAGEQQLFAAITADDGWPAALAASAADLANAERDVAQLAAIEKQNRRGDRARAEQLLLHGKPLRTSAERRAAAVQQEARHWVELKRNLPATVQQMERDYNAVRGFDSTPAAAAVQKAAADWPEKKSDLEARLAGLREAASQSEKAWEATAADRRRAASGSLDGLDFGVLIPAAESLRNAAVSLPRKSAELTALTGQLYTVWDKLLVDLDQRRRAEKLRTVSTRDGKTTSSEDWVEVPRATFDAMKDNLGMAVEHKGAGKYDSEAERTAQPAGFAYVAPPGQRNQYGYWDRRDGRDLWVFYGQYALMRDLLFNRDYRPLDRGDWEGYRTSRDRNQTYYGQEQSKPQYGTGGAATQQRYSGSTFDRNGGFRDSKYASKSGSYRDSEFSTPAARDPNVDRSPQRFGSGGNRQASPPSRSYRPSAPSRSPSRSIPRRFGRR